ncbi:histone-lysine N-methyltransferase SETMAR [Trichonephila clavipes]|nr:histone-lysine N-methyltransferase SETMAR [Trichonephila clavipes]
MEANRNLCDGIGEKTVALWTFQRWLVKFCFSNLSLKNEPISRRPLEVRDEVLRSMIRKNPPLTSTKVSFKFGIHQTSALDYIKRLGFVSYFSI